VLAQNLRRFDKGGEQFYDQISALHKSVRGSDPDAALYWMVRMLDGGADPLYIGRRVVRMAVEDIGLADPRGLRIALDACETYERLGTPEGELALAEAVLYLSAAPKSNAVYEAYNAARAFVAKDHTRPVPMHLRNAPTRLMKELGYGKGYRYAHDEEGAYAAGESYFPEGMQPEQWYRPHRARARGEDPREARAPEKPQMIDIQTLRKDPEAVAKRLATRGPGAFDLDRFQKLESTRKQLQTAVEQAQASKNRIARDIGTAKAKGQDVAPVLEEAEKLKALLERSEQQLVVIQQEMQDFLRRVPNIPHESVPVGASSDDNREERRWSPGNSGPRKFDFAVKDHVDIGERLGGIDFATGAKVAGSRFVVMRGQVARLHRALAQFMLDTHTREHGYTEVYAPYMVSAECADGVSSLSKFKDDLFKVEGREPVSHPDRRIPGDQLRRGRNSRTEPATAEIRLPLSLLPLRSRARQARTRAA
jgi:hypothetical protein